MLKYGSIFVIIIAVCIGCNSYSEPKSKAVSIAYLKSLYRGIPLTITDDIAIQGWVISTDQFGGWYKTIVIEDESGGIELKINKDNLFLEYWIGDMVSVKCNNLVLNSYGGLLQIDGITNEVTKVGKLEQAPSAQPIKIAELNTQLISRYVIIQELQFIDEEIGETLGSKQEYINRHLIDCARDTVALRISPNFRYVADTITSKSGWVKGVVSYFNGEYELVLNKISDLALDDDRF